MATTPVLWSIDGVPQPTLMRHPNLLRAAPELDLSLAITSEAQRNPAILEFLQPSTPDDFSIATQAYSHAKDVLAKHLARDQMESIEAVRSIHDLRETAMKAQEQSRSRSRWSRRHNVLLTLDRYKGVLDVIAQAHAEYTCFAWGVVKWLLTAAVNYMALLQKISAMLDDIGYRLPRIQLYHNLLPSKRLARVTSEIYAAVIDCFVQTVLFFNKSRTRRFLSILSGPLESEFRETLARIERLSDLVEGDARAAAVVSQHAINTTLILQLQEIKLITKHAMTSVLEVKQLQTKALLQDVRTDLFHGSYHDLTFQYDMMKIFTSLVAPAWNPWYLKEMEHVPFYHQKQAAFSYVQTEQLQLVTMFNIVSQKPHRPDYTAQTSLCWSPRMTKETALASLIYQYLEQYPERLLFRHPPDYYASKIRSGSRTLESLIEIYLQIVAALPGSRSMLMIPSDSPEATTFLAKMIDLCQYSTSNLHSMIIYHVTDPGSCQQPKGGRA